MTTLRDPHDQFFKAVFSQPAMAADFLHHYLPPAVAAVLDPTGLRIAKDSFVDHHLHPHYSDILYQVLVRDGGEAYVYVLFEHKSFAERLVALDLLRYEVRIWEDDLKAHAKDKLPVIIPLAVYHGCGPWPIPTDFGALLAVPAALCKYVPDFRYIVIDLGHRPDEELRGEVMLQVTLLLFKYIGSVLELDIV